MHQFEQELKAIAHRSQRPFQEVLKYHFLEGILRRVALSKQVNQLVLRGGMLTRLWVPCGTRIAADVDFLGLYPFNLEMTKQLFQEILTIQINDGIIIEFESLDVKGIWLHTDFPGVRINVLAAFFSHQELLQIDIGFGDPLIPDPMWINYPTLINDNNVNILTARPETMAGWKLHCLVEQKNTWRTKDIYDLMLLAQFANLDHNILPEAIKIAFSSRCANLEDVKQMLKDVSWWNTVKKRRYWRWYCRQNPTQIMSDDLLTVATIVVDYWGKIINQLI